MRGVSHKCSDLFYNLIKELTFFGVRSANHVYICEIGFEGNIMSSFYQHNEELLVINISDKSQIVLIQNLSIKC